MLAAMREPMMPRPRNPIRSDISAWGTSESSSARGLDAQPLSWGQRTGRLAGQRPAVEQIASRHPIAASRRSTRAVPAPLRDQREGHLLLRLDHPHHPVAAAVPALPAGAAPDRILEHPQREFPLQCLDWSVQRVAHRHVHAAWTIGLLASSLTAAERLVVGEGPIAEAEVVHRALALRAPV